jgi:hypothetical protein
MFKDPNYFIQVIDDKENPNFLGNLNEARSPNLWWLDARKRVNTKGCGNATLKLKTTQLPFKGGMNKQPVGLLKFVAHTSTIGALNGGIPLEDQDTHRTFGKPSNQEEMECNNAYCKNAYANHIR